MWLNAFMTLFIFAAKLLLYILAIGILLAVVLWLIPQFSKAEKEKITIKKINQQYDEMADFLKRQLLPKKAYQQFKKEKNKKDKIRTQQKNSRRRLFVLHFDGDLRASDVHSLREEITALLMITRADDEVLVTLESGGGLVHAYGLAASQLQRIRDHGISLTVAIDKIAASGGYMMACVAHQIMAAPFAIIGSIGVIAQLPNFNRLLKKHDIDFEQITAGGYKRTISLFGENTPEGRQKLQQETNEIHGLFKNFVKQHRPQVDIEKLATGEHWCAQKALELNLVDTVMTSDDYLMQCAEVFDIYEITYQRKKKLAERITSFIYSFARPFEV